MAGLSRAPPSWSTADKSTIFSSSRKRVGAGGSLWVKKREVRWMTLTGAAKYKGTKMREEKLTEMIEKKIKEATEVCQGDERSEECKVAWDQVEEVSQAKADLRLKLQNQDPLESFCQENPETDECRIYQD